MERYLFTMSKPPPPHPLKLLKRLFHTQASNLKPRKLLSLVLIVVVSILRCENRKWQFRFDHAFLDSKGYTAITTFSERGKEKKEGKCD